MEKSAHDSRFGSSGVVSRRTLLKGAAVLAAARSIPVRASEMASSGKTFLLFVSGYTPNGQGINLFSFDANGGKLTFIKVAALTTNPSWMALHPTGKFLYAVNEISNFNGGNTGSVSACSLDPDLGDLTFLNAVSSGGSGPVHVSVHPSGKFALVANYGNGSIAVLPILANGSLGNATFTSQDIGNVGPIHATNAPPGSFAISGHDAPHAHQIESDPLGQFVLHT